MMLGGASFEKMFGTEEETVPDAVQEIFGEALSTGSFADMFAAAYQYEMGEKPQFAVQNEWQGPGFYSLCATLDGIYFIAWFDEQEEMDEYEPVQHFAFLGNEVPERARKLADEIWEGPGYYAVKTVREKFWCDDEVHATYAETAELLAEGLFRNIDELSMMSFAKCDDDDPVLENAYFFECPEEPHGYVCPF